MFEHTLPGWSRVNLTDLATYINGYAFRPEDWSEHGLPIVRIAQITGSSANCDYYQGHLSEDVKIDSSDIIFSWSGTLCVVQWNGGPAWLNQHLFKVKPAEGISHRLLYHVLSHAVAEMDKSAHGSTMKHIKRGELKRYQILFPDCREEQDKIGKILDTLDIQIHKTEALIAKLEKVKEGLLHDLLTRGIDENGRLRPSPEQAPELYKETPLGLIPREWDISCVEEEFDITSGVTLGTHRRPKKNPTPYLRVANVHRDRLVLDEISMLEMTPVELEAKALGLDDLLIIEGHANPNEIGRCAKVTEEAVGLTFQNHLFRLRTNNILAGFASLWMNSNLVRGYWRATCSTSSGLHTINRTQLSGVPLAKPPKFEQGRISSEYDKVQLLLKTEADLLEKLQFQKQGIMDDLLTGRVRVTPLLDQAQAITPA